ncbi:SigE family RNA polymerase sigma factor [Thalassiella azotivora]
MSRDDEEFTAWASARAAALRRTAFLVCADWHLADDLVQTTLVKVHAAWPRLRRRDALDAYARRTLVRVAIDESRRPWRREHSAETVPEPRPAPGGGAPPVEDGVTGRLDALALLDELAPGQRAVMVLRYWEDLPVEQVAELLDVSVGTVKSQAHKAARTLRQRLATGPGEPVGAAPQPPSAAGARPAGRPVGVGT